jgi:hypothetical protein
MDDLKITVAVTQPFPLVFAVPSPPRYGAAYGELPKTTVDAAPDEALRDVLRRAADQLSIRPDPSYLETMASLARRDGQPFTEPHVSDMLVYAAFRRDDDDEIEWEGEASDEVMRRRNVRLQTTTLIVRDDTGRAVWRKPGLNATYRELLDAADAGLIDGDPLRPYLIPSIPQGDLGTLGEWAHFIDALKVIWDATEALATLGGAWASIELVRRVRRRRSDQAIDAVNRHAASWSDRGAAPADLLGFLISKPRATADIAGLLGCSDTEAEAILWAFGFVFDPEQHHWVYRGDPVAHLLGDDLDLSFADVFLHDGWEARLQVFVTHRLEQLGQAGSAPALDDARAQVMALADALHSFRPGFTSRMSATLARARRLRRRTTE